MTELYHILDESIQKMQNWVGNQLAGITSKQVNSEWFGENSNHPPGSMAEGNFPTVLLIECSTLVRNSYLYWQSTKKLVFCHFCIEKSPSMTVAFPGQGFNWLPIISLGKNSQSRILVYIMQHEERQSFQENESIISAFLLLLKLGK